MNTKRLLTVSGFILMIIVLTGCPSENNLVFKKFTAGKSKMVICPVHLLDKQGSIHDGTLSKKIVDYINERKYAVASLTEMCPPPNIQWKGDQAVMVDDSIELFRSFIMMNNVPANTYVFYTEFLRGGKDSRVVGIHYYLLDNKGEIAMRGILNSHTDEFKNISPVTNEDCLRVLTDAFDNKLME